MTHITHPKSISARRESASTKLSNNRTIRGFHRGFEAITIAPVNEERRWFDVLLERI
ncbi:uncharacterized protein PHALS_00583 [Plasmopara halstedii]|uniref:Uncharacterized protein n=1 Tax=Plasmopara halstedii TaxID=4781 RepID=A0A0P1ART7_PLAHL|nr:uncharacterized protein PHALS_00583 [Plasmopara halstedii]CEG44296.1 hypothetical protein PHALS_00583 [Plasmopara halstedii]|eukprot:XP_024580665.1 hypothetical protein PHALS_00583 [Plasmopara halstedii]